jgi:glycosyltransferase involved in cell wall biosynthesis
LPSPERAQTFAIVANGFADGPAQALRDYLVDRQSAVFAVSHPLSPEDGRTHAIRRYVAGGLAEERTVRTPLRAPLSFVADPLIPLLPPRVDAWFGFNPLACARGLLARRQGRARFVGLWSVDFVPDRFGAGSPLTRLYDRLDRTCCVKADARIELSEAALEGRQERHELPDDAAPAHIVPMGAWLDRVPTTTPDSFARRRAVFLGHLVPRQGVELFVDALALLAQRGEPLSADIVGTGPLETALREQVKRARLDDLVTLHGFVHDHRNVEHILSRASVAVAPYAPTPDTFTRYADPGKLKAYLAAGLPIVLTDVPPNARELGREAGAVVVEHDRTALADALAAAHRSEEEWSSRRDAALTYARRFDWATLLPELLGRLALPFA